ncbi:Pr6Pr family membrane protein [Dyella sp.]|uniref:Pr6Pr family membrane protein n=1 Tax=Dyella sp. TaxID=1869338 RepID=UPI002B45BD29|nr:Pr6Pr family membrane protein [Dyella sp.]HKT26909.1 Pr6Pr family membrane protein [Dyella sp.]
MNASTVRARPLAALIAVAAWFGVFLQLYLSLRLTGSMGMSPVQGVAIYLGYFTVLTNLLVGMATTLPLVVPSSTWAGFFVRPTAIGWVTASIAFVGIAYFVLLRHMWNPQGLQLLADVVMHYIVPALVVIYSLMALRRAPLRWTSPLWWSLYPIGYFAYVLVRGALMGHYPYHFIDVSQLGYALVLRNAAVLLAAFLGLSCALMLVWRRLG